MRNLFVGLLLVLSLIPVKKASAADNQMRCLVEAVYREAHGATETDMWGVARTILNRTHHAKDFASTPCGVIRQKTHRVRQFSWSKHLFVRHLEKDMDKKARRIVLRVLTTRPKGCEKDILFFARRNYSVGVRTRVCFAGKMTFRVPL